MCVLAPCIRHAGRVEADEPVGGEVVLRLTKPEALVLFDWLHRLEDQAIDAAQLGVVDQAEERVLWDLSASLESALPEPFLPEYAELLDAARAQVRDSSR